MLEMLQVLGRTKLSGALHIECPQRFIDVHFVRGRIADTRVPVQHGHRPPEAGFITLDTQAVPIDISCLGEEYCLAV